MFFQTYLVSSYYDLISECGQLYLVLLLTRKKYEGLFVREQNSDLFGANLGASGFNHR
jgi:hypothetical protein